MSARARDTTAEAEALQVEVLRRLPGPERLRLAIEMSETVLRLARAGLRRRMPEATEEELKTALVRLRYGSPETGP